MKPPPFPDLAQRMRVRTECTGSNLRRATRAVSRIYDEALAPAGLRGTQFSLLIALSFFKEAPLLRVAEELGLDRLTDAGQRILQRAYPLWEEAQAKVVNALGQRRWMMLLEGLAATKGL